MAIVYVGSGGTGVDSSSSTSFTLTTSGDLSLSTSRFCVMSVSTDNSSTTDGDNNEHTSVTGGTGTWTKLGEYTNSNGSAAAGVTTSAWLFEPSGANASGTVFTINLASAVVDKAAQIRRCTWDTSKSLRAASGTTAQTMAVDASNDFGSASFSSLASQERLYVAALGKEANTTSTGTASTDFTVWSAVRSRNNAAAIINRGELRINTSTGETSNFTLAVSGDTAGVFVAVEEYSPASAVAPPPVMPGFQFQPHLVR